MKIKKGTEVGAVVCNREVENSIDLIQAINQSEVSCLQCRKGGKRPKDCAGLRSITLVVKATKTGRKMNQSRKRCPVDER
jgi:hypothetical protein